MMYSWCEHQDCLEIVCILCTTTGPLDKGALYEQSKKGVIATVCCKKHNTPERFMETLPDWEKFERLDDEQLYVKEFLPKTFMSKAYFKS